jgi:tetratricopeptide (TPR) repeat protein
LQRKLLDRKSLGTFLKRRRKQLKKRQEDFVDNQLSQTVISHIESGNQRVSQNKIVYYAKKLGIAPEELDRFKRLEKEGIQEKYLQMIAIENYIQLVDPVAGLKELQQFPLAQNDHFEATVQYLKGKALRYQGKLQKAYDCFYRAIQLSDQFRLKKTNLISACFQELSVIEYYENRLQTAIDCAKEAIASFDPDGERQYVYDQAMISLIIYHEKRKEVGEAQKVLHQWEHREWMPMLIGSTHEATLNAYEMKARLTPYPKSVEVALRGIELARVNGAYDRSFELWTTLGGIYVHENEFRRAEICFHAALSLKDLISQQHLLSYAHNQLGNLYFKQHQHQRSLKEFQEAVRYAKKHNDKYQELDGLEGLGRVFFEEGNLEQAILVLQDAVNTAKKYEIKEKMIDLLLSLGKALALAKDPKFLNVAQDYFRAHITLEGGESMLKNKNRNVYVGDPPGT